MRCLLAIDRSWRRSDDRRYHTLRVHRCILLRRPSKARKELPTQDERTRWQRRVSPSSPQAWRARSRRKEMPGFLRNSLFRPGRERVFLRHRPDQDRQSTSRTMSQSIVFRCKAHPSDNELKQRLLILRGMPSLYWAITASASRGKQRRLEAIAGCPQSVLDVELRVLAENGFRQAKIETRCRNCTSSGEPDLFRQLRLSGENDLY